MRRTFLLPALAACAMLAVGAPAASASKAHSSATGTGKAITFLLKANKKRASETGALRDIAKGYDAAFATIHSALDPIVAAVPTVLDALTKLKDGLTKVGDGLTALSAAVQGPSIAGQLGAGGSTPPGASNTATPDTLPASTLYRQIVVGDGSFLGGAVIGKPVGGRIWMKTVPPGTASPFTNHWVCISANGDPATTGGHPELITCTSGPT